MDRYGIAQRPITVGEQLWADEQRRSFGDVILPMLTLHGVAIHGNDPDMFTESYEYDVLGAVSGAINTATGPDDMPNFSLFLLDVVSRPNNVHHWTDLADRNPLDTIIGSFTVDDETGENIEATFRRYMHERMRGAYARHDPPSVQLTWLPTPKLPYLDVTLAAEHGELTVSERSSTHQSAVLVMYPEATQEYAYPNMTAFELADEMTRGLFHDLLDTDIMMPQCIIDGRGDLWFDYYDQGVEDVTRWLTGEKQTDDHRRVLGAWIWSQHPARTSDINTAAVLICHTGRLYRF